MYKKYFLLLIILNLISSTICFSQEQEQKQSNIDNNYSNFEEAVFKKFKGDVSYFVYFHSKYPEKARKKSIEGIISTNFTIDKNGNVKDINVSDNLDESCKQEAIRLIKLTDGEWYPGKVNGVIAETNYKVPIFFVKPNHKQKIGYKKYLEERNEEIQRFRNIYMNNTPVSINDGFALPEFDEAAIEKAKQERLEKKRLRKLKKKKKKENKNN